MALFIRHQVSFDELPHPRGLPNPWVVVATVHSDEHGPVVEVEVDGLEFGRPSSIPDTPI